VRQAGSRVHQAGARQLAGPPVSRWLIRVADLDEVQRSSSRGVLPHFRVEGEDGADGRIRDGGT